MDGLLIDVNQCRPAVRKFALLMEQKLREHDAEFPNGWAGDHFSHLYKRMLEEAGEIIEAEGLDERALECADVANLAMMLADKCLWNYGR